MELKILKQEETPENVIEHSKAVCKKAMKIADNFKDADKDLIKKGALLHDIGRSKTHGITHAVEGAKIVREYGYPEEVQNIVERQALVKMKLLSLAFLKNLTFHKQLKKK